LQLEDAPNAGLPKTLVGREGTLTLEAIELAGSKLQALRLSFEGTFVDPGEDNEMVYELSGTLRHEAN
jgi:hypothetical protein